MKLRIPEEVREEGLRKVLRVATQLLVQINRALHRMLSDGVERIVAYRMQFRTLATLRDTLLPKLLSGELRATPVPPA